MLEIFQSHIHGTNINAEVFEFAQQVEEVVGRERQLDMLNTAIKGPVRFCERLMKSEGGGGARGSGCSAGRLLRLAILLTLQVQRVGEGFFMCSNEAG